jgi:hypothetical protein
MGVNKIRAAGKKGDSNESARWLARDWVYVHDPGAGSLPITKLLRMAQALSCCVRVGMVPTQSALRKQGPLAMGVVLFRMGMLKKKVALLPL